MTSIRKQIVSALTEGFSYKVTSEEFDTKTVVHVETYDQPIIVFDNDIDVPDCYPPEVKAGIRLDIQVILGSEQ